MGTKFERYRVEEGDKVDLDALPTDDDAAYGGDRDEAYQRLDELRDEIAELQNRLYAEEKHKVLFVLQAMVVTQPFRFIVVVVTGKFVLLFFNLRQGKVFVFPQFSFGTTP